MISPVVLAQLQVHGDTTLLDSVVVRSPLPGGVASVVRFLFNLPQWFQIGGLVVGLAVAAYVLWLLWQRRRAILHWILSRPRPVLVGLGSTVVVLVALVALFARVSWNYVQHNNNFCVSCHVMVPAYSRFETSAHSKLECHDCHQESIVASAMQVYYWVAERPAAIPPHAKVPNGVCLHCHDQDTASHTWQRILATAGHTVHLRSSAPALRNLQCVTCHGVEIHRFAALDETCSKSGCHVDALIRLGKMANQSEMHCTICHQFNAPVSAHLSTDSAARFLSPASPECLHCHEMRNVMTSFDVTRDPHHGQCGWCHDPHKQTTAAAAIESCTRSGCHAQPETLTPMHRGLPPGTLARCTDCHVAHTWVVRGTACQRCHGDIMRPPPAASAPPAARPVSAVRTASARAAALSAAVAAVWTPARGVTAGGPRLPAAAEREWLAALDTAAPAGPRTVRPVHPTTPDTLPSFSHRIHRSLPCASCHNSTQEHGAVLLHSVRDCQACHHAANRPWGTDCARCHSADNIPAQIAVPVTFRMSVLPAPVDRTLSFAHAQHASLACAACHTQPVTLAPRSCDDCHADHHRGTVACADCHHPALDTHTRLAHLGCSGSGCHTDAAVLALEPSRNVCLACHQQQVHHEPGKECASCHAVDWMPRQPSETSP